MPPEERRSSQFGDITLDFVPMILAGPRGQVVLTGTEYRLLASLLVVSDGTMPIEHAAVRCSHQASRLDSYESYGVQIPSEAGAQAHLATSRAGRSARLLRSSTTSHRITGAGFD
jgi:hypothetical protein